MTPEEVKSAALIASSFWSFVYKSELTNDEVNKLLGKQYPTDQLNAYRTRSKLPPKDVSSAMEVLRINRILRDLFPKKRNILGEWYRQESPVSPLDFIAGSSDALTTLISLRNYLENKDLS